MRGCKPQGIVIGTGPGLFNLGHNVVKGEGKFVSIAFGLE